MRHASTISLQWSSPARWHSAIARVSVALLMVYTGLGQAHAQLRTEVLQARFFQITVEIADTPASRTQGLMGRPTLPNNHGMLFVFDRPEPQCFWMKNTPLPLTIAFIADDGRIVNFADMQPFSEQPHCSASPVRFALEMEQGWFKRRGLLAGDILTGKPLSP